jgi:hypothetical protein
LAERRKVLATKVQEFRTIQKVYMPGLSHLLDEGDGDSGVETHPELFKLILPSQLSIEDRDVWCLPGLATLEARFRYAQANDALAEIRRLRRLFQGLSDQNRKHITNSQNTLTRAKGTFERYKARISQFASFYRHARRSLVALDPKGEITRWTSRFLELKEADIRGPGREEDEVSEGHHKPSWIWDVLASSQPPKSSRPDASSSDSDESDLSSHAASGEEVAVSIQAHWARCQARAERHEEEVQLTVEEMRRTVAFFQWKSGWWLTLQDVRGKSTVPPDPQVQHGLRAYANRQASMYSSLATTYVNHWRRFLVQHSLGLEWLKLYPIMSCSTTKTVPVEGTDEPLEGDEDEAELDSEVLTDQEFEEMFADLHGN